jgi:hypothetical protein
MSNTIDPLVEAREKIEELHEKEATDITIFLKRYNEKTKDWVISTRLLESEVNYDFIQDNFETGLYLIHIEYKLQEGSKAKEYCWDGRQFGIEGKLFFEETEAKQDNATEVMERMKDYFDMVLKREDETKKIIYDLYKEKAEDKSTTNALQSLVDLVKTKIKEDKPDNTPIVEAIKQVGTILPTLLQKPANQDNSFIAELIKQNTELQKMYLQSLEKRKSIDWQQIVQIGTTIVDQISKRIQPATDNPAVAIIRSIAEIAQEVLPQLVEAKYFRNQSNQTALPQVQTEPQGDNNQDKAIELFLKELVNNRAYDKNPSDVAQVLADTSPETIDWLRMNSNKILSKSEPGQRNWLIEFFNSIKQSEA